MKDDAAYKWFVDEVNKVNLKKFFDVIPIREPEWLSLFEEEHGILPSSYRRWIVKFGHARLFRNIYRGTYFLAVFAPPRITKGKRDLNLIEVGYYINSGYAYLKQVPDEKNISPEVFEGSGLSVKKVADSFEDWLRTKFQRARKLYKKSEWDEIVKGAAPFS